MSEFKKAAKIYQKINAFYSFGDAKNNFRKEDENSEDYVKNNAELMGIKVVTFNNLVVCKYKTQEFDSIISITDQILLDDPKNIKALYFRGKAFIEKREFKKAVDCLTVLCHADPAHSDGRNELLRAKKLHKEDIDKQASVYGKFFKSDKKETTG